MNQIVTAQPTELAAQEIDVSLLAGSVSQNTIEQYKIDFAQYILFAGQETTTPAKLAQWRQHLFETTYIDRSGNEKPYTVSRINRMLASVRSVMRAAAEQGYLPQSIADEFRAVRGLKVRSNKDRRKTNSRTRITKDQMIQICNAPNAETPAGLMHRALMLTLASSGIRISEAVTLTSDQIEWYTDEDGKSGWVIFVAGKNEVEEKPRAIGKSAKDAIDEWLEARSALGITSGYIFTGFAGRGSRPLDRCISRQGAWQIVQRYADQCELSDIKPHDFRRYVGTELAKKDLRLAQNQLGHKRIETTAQNYVLDNVAVGITDDLI